MSSQHADNRQQCVSGQRLHGNIQIGSRPVLVVTTSLRTTACRCQSFRLPVPSAALCCVPTWSGLANHFPRTFLRQLGQPQRAVV
jgi:hypothetical protein